MILAVHRFSFLSLIYHQKLNLFPDTFFILLFDVDYSRVVDTKECNGFPCCGEPPKDLAGALVVTLFAVGDYSQ